MSYLLEYVVDLFFGFLFFWCRFLGDGGEGGVLGVCMEQGFCLVGGSR